tara:strand:+ start:17125 stop:17664 length:540 start_codon:yes stop_codon:yes gene_type:complete
MSSKHSAEFKAKVALEAVSEENKIYSELAKKYDISVDEVLAWTSELKSNAASVFGGSSQSHAHHTSSIIEDVSIESDDSIFIESVNHGVENENLDYNKLFLWSGLGVVTVIVFIVSLIFFSQYSYSNAQKNASNSSTYLEITKLKADQTEHLNSYGVVDLEDGVYRIPIEEAINKIAVD